MVLTVFEWLPLVTHVEAGDGDQYWDEEDGQPRNVWRFSWRLDGVSVVPNGAFPGGSVNIEAQIVIEDGVQGEPQALGIWVRDPQNSASVVGGSSGFRGRAFDESMRRLREEVTVPVRVAWFNGDAGGAYLAVSKNAEGSWCFREYASTGEGYLGSCGFSPGSLNRAVQAGLSTSYDPATDVWGPYSLEIVTQPHVMSVVVVTSAGESLRLATSAAPPETGIAERFAYIGFGTVESSFNLVPLDAGGSEVWRETLGRAAPPPPPPRGGRTPSP